MQSAGTSIANIMLGRGLGGIEQAFLDYTEALTRAGYRPISIISNGAAIETPLRDSGFAYFKLSQWGWWDLLAARRLRKLLQRERAAAIITHGNRALTLSLFAARERIPVIAVAHNYSKGRYEQATLVVATTNRLRDHLVASGVTSEQIAILPNVSRAPIVAPASVSFRNPPVIGAMGRMVDIKGFDVLCEALATLKSQGVEFRAVLAGDGNERRAIEQKIDVLDLGEQVTLPGWIGNEQEKAAFWQSIDIFCLPSIQEAFGIVLLEAWAAARPVVTTDTNGPGEIATDGIDALIAPKNDAKALAAALHKLINNSTLAQTIAANGNKKMRDEFTLDILVQRIPEVVARALGSGVS